MSGFMAWSCLISCSDLKARSVLQSGKGTFSFAQIYARPPAQSHLRLSMVENRSRRAPGPICVQIPRGPKSRGPANCLPRRAIALGYSRRPCAGSRKHRRPVHRWSKIGRVACPHQYACNDRGGRNIEVWQPARAVAPSLSATLPDRARQPAHSRRRFSTVENRSHRPPTPTCAQASV